MKKKERKRLSDASRVAVVCLVIHFVGQRLDDLPMNKVARAQLEKVRRWNSEALRDFGITDAKASRQTADAIQAAYAELAQRLSPKLEALPERIFPAATAICVDALLADALIGRRELRRTPAMRYLGKTWETLTLMLSTGEDEAAVEGTKIYEEVV